MEGTMNITYHGYLAWICSHQQAIDPYTEHQWDTMSSINNFGICLAVRDWQNANSN